MPCKSSSPIPREKRRKKKNKCDEECLRRIAARLCVLDSNGSNDADGNVSGRDVKDEGSSCCQSVDVGCCGGEGACCAPSSVEKDVVDEKSAAGCCDSDEQFGENCCDEEKGMDNFGGCSEEVEESKSLGCGLEEEIGVGDSGCCSKEKVVEDSGCCSKEKVEEKSGFCSKEKVEERSGCCSNNEVVKKSSGCCTEEKVVEKSSGCCSSDKALETPSGCCYPSGKAAVESFPTNKPSGGCCCEKKVSDSVTTASECCAPTSTQKSGFDGQKSVADCCSSEKKTETVSGCCSSGKSATTSSGCCSSTTKKSCCPPKILPKKVECTPKEDSCCEKSSTNSNCCSKSPEARVQPLDECGDSCCHEIAQDSSSSTLSAGLDNLQSTMNRLEAMLKRGQCLCRRVQEQWGFNCCDPASAQPGVISKKGNVSPTPSSRDAISKGKSMAVSTATAIHSRCSFDAPNLTKNRKQEAAVKPRAQPVDVEQDSAREHVVLDVSGMTCTGCSKKMMNVLGGISGLSNPQVTFVSGNAEFDLDPGIAGKVEDVLQRVEKETGFKCSRLVSGFQELHVLVSGTDAKEIADSLPAGVMSVIKDKKKMDNYYITYNPRVVGARAVIPHDAELAPPQDSAGIAEGKKRLLSTALSTTLAAVLTIPVVVLEWSDNPLPSSTVELVALILGTGVQAIAIPEFYVGAIKSLVYSRVIEMDMLVVISITGAYGYSVVAYGLQRAGVGLEQGPFFETSTLLITLVLLGRLMAAWARMKALSSVSLRSLQAETALLVGPSGETLKVDARLLQFGDSIVVQPHSRIVTDGTVVDGASDVDESMVTGESLPVAKQIGDNLIAGTINGSGTLRARLTRLPGENSITDIATLVENAVAAKPRVQDLADKVAGYFIPAVVAIAIVVFCIWIAVSIIIRNRNGGGAVGLAITYAIAVLAISCPCALGLAVPMVLVIAGGVAARAGVVIKAADAIERSYKVTDVVFDKTGTLTEGDLQVVHTQTLTSSSLSEDEILAIGKAMVEGNDHPVSVAVAEHLAGKITPGISKPKLDDITSIPGAGIEAQYNDSLLKAGNPYWLHQETHPLIADLLKRAMTLLCITLNNQLILILGLKSTLRPNAASIIANLHRRKITTHIVSGDNPAAVLDIARTLGVEESHIRSRHSPAEKQQYVHSLQQQQQQQQQQSSSSSSSPRTILFLGDGTNDAVAIAQADVGVQMGSTSDVTGAVSDVVILSRDLGGLMALLELSRRAVRRIQFNFAWSAVYNLFAILLASGAFVRVRIEPAYAGLGEIVSVGPVIVAAVSLMWGRMW